MEIETLNGTARQIHGDSDSECYREIDRWRLFQ